MAASFTRQRLAGNHLEIPTFDLNLFTFCKARNELVGEASDLNGFRLGRLWNDACDVGLAIRSHLTDHVERFYLARQMHKDGELVGWELEPIDASCRVKELVVFND